MKFQHFVLTLFNLKIWSNDKRNTSTRTSDWLKSRFDIFEKYCLPSVMAQECKNFVWIVFFDVDTPEEYKSRIRKYEEMCPQFRPFFMDANDASLFRCDDLKERCRPFRNAVKSMLDSDCEYVITMNLDNDDAVAVNAIARVQEAFMKNPEEVAMIFPNGVQYIRFIDMMLKMKYPHNHFISLAEKADADFKTILYYVHTKVRNQMKVVDLDGEPGWLEIVHESNVSNELRITSRIKYGFYFGRTSLNGFGLSVSFSAAHNMCAFLFRYPVYFLKIANRKLRKKLIGK